MKKFEILQQAGWQRQGAMDTSPSEYRARCGRRRKGNFPPGAGKGDCHIWGGRMSCSSTSAEHLHLKDMGEKPRSGVTTLDQSPGKPVSSPGVQPRLALGHRRRSKPFSDPRAERREQNWEAVTCKEEGVSVERGLSFKGKKRLPAQSCVCVCVYMRACTRTKGAENVRSLEGE